ncbi:hypothetical protein [Streptomyces sp. ISL-94]|uniref:hypothetical protein n=1 Tax=Streptomyces sp. ISL-94 TaxID=2819190 RepID=UPI001BE92CB6|nr:hypothetical protein [Streptomyces sp. ISL-94]MBT2477697.1 hypothetical protein [Streptomyces sp. ISL-94]
MGIDEDLVRDAMERTTTDLPPLPDLAGAARAQGRRRKARARAAMGGAVLAVAALGVAGGLALPGGGGADGAQGAAGVGVAAAPPDAAKPQPPVHLEPTPGETPMSALPPAERARQENFQNQAVGVLQGLLPEALGTLQRTDLHVYLYQAAKDGKTFTVVFSVRPSGSGAADKPCLEIKGQTCAKATLPDGTEVHAATAPVNSGTVTESRVFFHYGNSDVRLTVNPHDASNTSAPVTKEQLLEVAKAPAFLDLVKDADRQPVQEKQKTVPLG